MITTNQTLIIDTEKIKRKESKCTTIENHEIQTNKARERKGQNNKAQKNIKNMVM